MKSLHLPRITGIVFILFAVAVNVPYWRLEQTFEYDEILRQSTDYVLTRFHAGGASLILTWFVFALLALLFIPVSVLLQKSLSRPDTPYLEATTLIGIFSGVLQAIGRIRWVFVVPVLACAYVDPAATDATRAAVTIVYQAIHQYGGVVIGEQLGQLLLVSWTIGAGVAMLHSPLVKPWLGWMGLATVPLWLLGQSELLATVMPQMPVLETTPIAFIFWELWLLATGICLLQVPLYRSRRGKRHGLQHHALES